VVSPDDAALADPPPWLLDLVQSSRPVPRTVTPQASIPEGARNDTLYRLARSLKVKGLTRSAISAALHAENQARCVPPLPSSEVDVILEHAATQADHPTFVTTAPAQDTEQYGDADGTREVPALCPVLWSRTASSATSPRTVSTRYGSPTCHRPSSSVAGP
jgi:hypothetical protein